MESEADDRERAREFAAQAIAPSVAARDRERCWAPELFRSMGAAGLLGATLPAAFGGAGRSAVALVGLMAGFAEGSGDAGLALAWAAHTLGCAAPLAALGSEAQRERWLPGLARGEVVGALAHAELSSAPTGVCTIAARASRGRWIVRGSKAWVVNGPVADLFVVTAVTDPAAGERGVSAFLVRRATQGLTLGRRLDAGTAAVGELVLDDCELTDADLLGAEGGGLTAVIRLVRSGLRACQFAPWLGFMRLLVDHSALHLREHQRHGRPLSHSQTARALLADMQIRVELSRRMLAHAAWQLDNPGDAAGRAVATSALFLAESVEFVARGALQLHGAAGLSRDTPVGRLGRDAEVAANLLVDSPDVLRAVIAGSLLGLG